MAIGLADLVWVRPTQELGCLVRGIAAGGCDRSWPLRGQSGSGFGQSVDGLAELGAGHVAQHGHQWGFLNAAKQLLCSLRQLDPVMPVADHVLHMVEEPDQARSLRIFAREFCDIACPLARNPELMQGLFSYRARV